MVVCGLTPFYNFQPASREDDGDGSSSSSSDFSAPYALAVTGEAFRWIVDYGALETMQRVNLDGRFDCLCQPARFLTYNASSSDVGQRYRVCAHVTR